MMLINNEEVLNLAEKHLDISDFGNWFGPDDAIIEFAYALIQLEKERIIENVMAA